MLNVRKIADIAQKMFNFPFFSPRCYFSLLNELQSRDSIGIISHGVALSLSFAHFLAFFVKMTLSFIWYIFVLMSKDLCRNEDLYLHKKLDGKGEWI